MGITGLIPFLEKASSKVHLRELRGQCVAIDSYCWLHKGAFACADKLARGETTDIHIQYCLKYVNLLLSHDIKPILVFDGRHLPAKAMTEAKRRESRDSSKKRAAELLRMGKTEEAKSFLRRCVDITHEMALQLIQECRRRNVDCVVAPHEADAQLAFLNKKGIAQAVITEDSDLMLFGCSKVLFKLDLTGCGLMIEAEKLYLAMGCKQEKYSFDKFRHMCILSGCDYLDSLPGIGLVKARKFVLLTEEHDIRKALTKIPAYLNMRQLDVSEEYKTNFLKADATFKHMIVYDPTKRKQTRLNDLEELGTEPELCCNAGTFLDDDTAFQLAVGNFDPFTMKKLDNWHPDDPNCQATGGQTSGWKQTSITKHPSIWKNNYEGRISTCKPDIRKDIAILNSLKMAEVVKRPVPNPEFEQAEQSESIDDVLEAYGIKPKEQQPPLKKLCLTMATGRQKKTIDFDEVQVLEDMEALENSPSKSPVRRNPFQVTSSAPIAINRRSVGGDTLLSPTKLTPENSSFLRNVSPVKKIDFDSKPTILQTRTKSEKLSRFKRTVIASDGQKVISRFFTGSSTCSSATSQPTAFPGANEPGSPIKEEKCPLEAASVYLLSPEAKLRHRGEQTPKKQKPLARNVDTCSPAPPVKGERSVEKLDSGFVEEPDAGFSSSQKENETVEVKPSRLQLFVKKEPARFGASSLIEICEQTKVEPGVDEIKGESKEEEVIEIKEEDEVAPPVHEKVSGPQRPAAGSSTQKKSSCRRVGLSKGKGLKDVGPTQSKLSMFGFQKKVQMK